MEFRVSTTAGKPWWRRWFGTRSERAAARFLKRLGYRILVRNFVDNTRDEFTARISAHAQYIVRQQGRIIRQDEYVSPFVEYWTFGRQNGEWKLKEVLPPAEGEKALSRENVDEESSADQLQWYYQKTRAI